ncbi:MAG: hypothetical protein ACHQRM_17205 [Bacteroidia bacterium]
MTGLQAQEYSFERRSSIGAEDIFPEKHLRFSTDLVKTSINEFQVIGEYRLSPFFSVGIIYGKVFRNPAFDPWFSLFVNNQDWPGTAYHGDAYTALLKFYPFQKKWRYLALKGVYKSICYSGQDFTERAEYYHYYYAHRSENARVTGFDLVYGKYRFLGVRPVPIEVFYGVGYRVRERNVTTYSESYDNRQPIRYYKNDPRFGTFPVSEHLEQTYLTLQLGILIGFNVRCAPHTKA